MDERGRREELLRDALELCKVAIVTAHTMSRTGSLRAVEEAIELGAAHLKAARGHLAALLSNTVNIPGEQSLFVD